MPNFFDEEKYALQYENMQLYLRLGLKLKDIHNLLELNQSRWLKPCIELNIQKRSRKKWKQRWKSVVQTNEQSYIQKNDVKLEKETRCKTRKQQKRLFKMYIKTNLYFVQNI